MRNNNDFTDTRKVRAIQLRQEGSSFSEISRDLGIPSTTVRYFINRKTHVEWWKKYNKGSFSKICNTMGFVSTAIPQPIPADANDYTLCNDSIKKLAVDMKENMYMSNAKIAKELNLEETCVRRFFSKITYQEWWENLGDASGTGSLSDDAVVDDGAEIPEEPVFMGEMDEIQYDHNYLDKNTVFVISSAQNNTHVNIEFMDALESYCSHNDAELLISPFYYNTSGMLGNKTDEAVYDDRVEPYLVKEPIKLCDYLGGLVFCAELDILPTAVNPFSGLHTYTKLASSIIPHTRMQLESVVTPKSDVCRMLYSTGTTTMRNYVQRKAGQKASFHHVFGALVVEIDHKNQCWYVRQLNSDKDGSIQDLDTVYMPDGSVRSGEIEAINWGDLHAEKCEQEQMDLCFGEKGILNSLQPRYQFAHDLSDFTPRNHHNRKDPHFLYKTSNSAIRTVEDGLVQAADVIKEMSRDWCETVIVNSNHDNALVKWLKEADYRTDPDNAKFFLTAQLECYDAIDRNDNNFSIFEKSLTELIRDPVDMSAANVKFLREDESFKICTSKMDDSIECGFHGHTGNNGARGSVMSYQRLSSRVNIGHSHSATIKDGVYQAGVTGNLDMGYNIGASSWSHSHIVTYANGKRTIITTHGEGWRLQADDSQNSLHVGT